MQNADLTQKICEEQASRIPEMPQRSAEPGFVPASTIERAAQRLDWTIAFGIRHNTPARLQETLNQQPRPNPFVQSNWLIASGAPLQPLGPRFGLSSAAIYNHAATHVSDQFKASVRVEVGSTIPPSARLGPT